MLVEGEKEDDLGLERCNKHKRHRLLRLVKEQRVRDDELNRALQAVMVFVYVAFNVFVSCLHVMGLLLLPAENDCGSFGKYMLARAVICGAFWPFAVLMQLLLPEWPAKTVCMGVLVMLYCLCFLVADSSVVPQALEDPACVKSLSAALQFNLLGVVAVVCMGCGALNVLLLFAFFLAAVFC